METLEKARQYLEEFRALFEPYFNQYLNEKLKEFAEIDSMGQIFTEKIRDFSVGGGKRIRPALVGLGYRAGGGDKTEDILPAAISIELLHNFFLIHDDIIDLSDIRRARPTIHKMFEHWFSYILESKASYQHICHSMAILAGDLSCTMAIEALTLVSLPPERIVRSLKKLCAIGRDTVIGEGLDVIRPFEDEVSEETVMQIYLLKTAKYTIEGPLHLGLLFAEADEKLLQDISKYAIPVGIAFQIQDDILGVFGTEEEIGKSITSDIKEGKQTLLTAAVRRLGTETHRERLKFLFGNPNIKPADIEEIKEIMRTTGALVYARSRAQSLAEEGKTRIRQLSIAGDIKEILEGLADYIVERSF